MTEFDRVKAELLADIEAWARSHVIGEATEDGAEFVRKHAEAVWGVPCRVEVDRDDPRPSMLQYHALRGPRQYHLHFGADQTMRTYPVSQPLSAIDAVTQILNEVETGNIVPTSTHALATHIVQTLCAHEWVTDYSGMVFKSNPEKRARHCLICGKNDTVIAHDERCMDECSKCHGADICGDTGGYCTPCKGQCMSWSKPKAHSEVALPPADCLDCDCGSICDAMKAYLEDEVVLDS
jgi:hypothetical protein